LCGLLQPVRGMCVTVLVVKHKVRDFGVWKSVFDEREPVRWWRGVRRHWLYRSAEDPDDVVVAIEFPSPEQARAYLQDPELRQAMQRGGVHGEPHIHLCEPVQII